MPWRIIIDPPRGAAENMAIDEAILRSCADGSSPPTIRIYSWQRPSISLGCLQPITDKLDLDYCQTEGIEVVRRITGGRAVIHGSDVTFSIAIRECDLPKGCANIIESHRWLMGGIVAGLQLLGIDAEIGPKKSDTSRSATADCFAHVAECDVRVGRTKIVGSAQMRRYGAILEQGSIPYTPTSITTRVFGGVKLAPTPSPLDKFSYSDIANAICQGFRKHLDCNPHTASLTQCEAELAAELTRGVYSTSEWTQKRV